MKYKETETVELKKSTSELKEAVISIVAILNKHQRGELYFGIKNDGNIVGQDVSGKTVRDVTRTISENIEPKIFPTVDSVQIDKKTCIKVVFNGSHAPYFAYGRAYIRVGDENRQLSSRELEGMFIKKNKELLAWDTDVCNNAKISDISIQKIKAYLKICGLNYGSLINSLNKLNLLKGGKLLKAGVIVFAKNPAKYFPNAKLRCAVFGTDDTTVVIDMQDYEGDILYLINQAEKYILENIHIGMRLDGLYRIDVPEIDKEAFREAVINAFCHRDYNKYDSVNIAIFRNRVEVRSPGLLYGGLTIARIRREMVSERRNELIAELFHRSHLIERWGRGINLILSKEPATIFKEVGTQFITVFIRKLPEGAGEVEEKDRGVEMGVEKGVEKISKKEQVIVDLIRTNPYISKEDMSRKGKLSKKTIEYNIGLLKKKHIIRRIGPDKGGYWEVVKKK